MREWTEIKGFMIKVVDAQCDRIVYDLYELTEEQIKIIEQA
jgi:hypothetical protein